MITKDDNFSGKAILETKLGHSMAIIGETVNEVADVMMDVLRRMNPNEDIQHSYRRVEKGPWTSGRSTRQFGNLMSIFEIKDETDIIRLDEDFRTLASLVQIVGTMKKLYPELMPRPDPQMKAFIRKCRMETDRILMPSLHHMHLWQVQGLKVLAPGVWSISDENRRWNQGCLALLWEIAI